MLELLFILLLWYVVIGLVVYAYNVIKNWEITGYVSFQIKNGYVGVCPYPRWLLFWLEYAIKKLRGV